MDTPPKLYRPLAEVLKINANTRCESANNLVLFKIPIYAKGHNFLL